MKRVNILIYTIISFVIMGVLSVAYVFYLQTLVLSKTKSNISVNVTETSSYIDSYAETHFKIFEKEVSDNNIGNKEFINGFLRKYGSYGFDKVGYYNDNTNEYYYDSLVSKKEGKFEFKTLSKDKTLNQTISLIEERFLFDNNSRTVMLLYCVRDEGRNFFALQKFSSFIDMLVNPYTNNSNSDTVKYFVSTNDGLITSSNSEEKNLLTMNHFFKEMTTREEFNNNMIKENSIVYEFDDYSSSYISGHSILSKYNSNDLYLYGLIPTTYVNSISNTVIISTSILLATLALIFIGFGIYLYSSYTMARKKYMVEGTLIRDDSHYSILLNKQGKIVSNNAKFASLGLKKRGIFSSCIDVLELNGGDEEFIDLLENRGDFTIKINDLEQKDRTIKFIVVKKKYGYQLLGYDISDAVIVPYHSERKEEKKNAFIPNIDELHTSIDLNSLYKDDLFDALNKKALYIRIEKIIEEKARNNQNTYLFYFGLSNEEEIVRTYGNAIEELVNASMLDAITKEFNGIEVYNIDDHHFAFFYELHDTFHSLTKMMEDIGTRLKKPAKILSNEIEIEIDFGIYHFASFNLEGVSPKKLLERAALAFRQAITLSNKTYKIYDSNLEIAFELDDIIARDIRNGLDNNEFVTYFQPNYSLKDDRVSGFECLLRWNNDKYRYDSPFKYIQVAEKVGLINEIGYFTLTESFKLIKELNDPYLHISVNVSPAQFLQTGFISKLVSMYTEYDVPYSSICIEITETFLIQSMNEVIEKLKYLRSFGIKVYLDDFGTGYSSLLYLAELPVDVIKIDKAFITPLKTSKSSRTIVSELIQIATELNMEVVAEGVEDDYQVNFLEKKKCMNIQGYYFSKPVPKEQVKDTLDIKRKKKKE